MTPSWRKPVGALAIIAMLTLWCVLVASLSATVGGWHWIAQLAFYVVAAEAQGVPPGAVFQTFQKGYVLNERLLRPAMVVVAKHD